MVDFVDEVMEDVRRQRTQNFFKQHGNFIIGLAICVIVGVAGGNWWQNYSRSQAVAAGEAFYNASSLPEAQREKKQQAFAAITEHGGDGYKALAQLRMGTLAFDANKTDEASAAFSSVAQAHEPFSSLASVMAAYVQLEAVAGQPLSDEQQTTLQAISDARGPWRHLGTLLLGISEAREGNADAAKARYDALITDATVARSIADKAKALRETL